MEKVKIICLNCGIQFEVFPCHYRRGSAKFCSRSCSTTYRNKHDNPAWRLTVKEKISKNHHNVSGRNNPMFDRRGEKAPGYIDGRRIDKDGKKLTDAIWRQIAFKYKEPICEFS